MFDCLIFVGLTSKVMTKRGENKSMLRIQEDIVCEPTSVNRKRVEFPYECGICLELGVNNKF